jgi:hypothetical protein
VTDARVTASAPGETIAAVTNAHRAEEDNGEEREYVLQLRTPGEDSQDLLRTGSIRVIVEDDSPLGESPTVVDEAAAEPGPTASTLAVRAALRPRHQYLVRVHVDATDDGVISPGDLIGAAHIDADTPSSERIDVHLTQVLEQPTD